MLGYGVTKQPFRPEEAAAAQTVRAWFAAWRPAAAARPS
jgi:hypothetical protein